MKRIRFVAKDTHSEHTIPPPIPAKQFIPEWYKRGEMYLDSSTLKVTDKSNPNHTAGMKACIPFLDVMVSGYMLHTWADIEITKNDSDNIEFRHIRKNEYNDEIEEYQESSYPLIDLRTGDIGHTIPRPHGHAHHSLVWPSPWGFRLPKNWSLLVTHPFNRYELPFTTLSAIMDADEWWTGGNVPFFIKEGWTGIIPKGTPFAQLMPIKRESWISHISPWSKKRSRQIGERARNVTMGFYKKNIWVRKEFN